MKRAVSVVVACSLLAAGCGNIIHTDLRGRIGFALGEDQQILLRINPCGLNIDNVRIGGAAEQMGDYRANPRYLMINSPEGQEEPFIIDPADIQAPWTIEINEPLPDDPSKALLGNAHVIDRDAGTGQVSAYISQIQEIPPGMVLVGVLLEDNKLVTEEEFLYCHPGR